MLHPTSSSGNVLCGCFVFHSHLGYFNVWLFALLLHLKYTALCVGDTPLAPQILYCMFASNLVAPQTLCSVCVCTHRLLWHCVVFCSHCTGTAMLPSMLRYTGTSGDVPHFGSYAIGTFVTMRYACFHLVAREALWYVFVCTPMAPFHVAPELVALQLHALESAVQGR